MDTVISLRRPKVYNMAEGARFQVHLTKARGITGKDALPFEVHLRSEENLLHWDVVEIAEAEMDQVKKLLEEGYTIRECAEEMGISKSTVHRFKQTLEERA